MKKCLIYLESNFIQDGIALLEVIRQYYAHEALAPEDIETVGVLINEDPSVAHGYFDKLVSVNDPLIKAYDATMPVEILSRLNEAASFDMILISSTWLGRMVMPRLAVRLKTGLTADVTEIRRTEQITQMVRPAYSGRLLAGIVNCTDGPVMMSVRQNVFQYSELPNKLTQILTLKDMQRLRDMEISHDAQSLRDMKSAEGHLKDQITEASFVKKEINYDIRESEILVAGGGGVIKRFNALDTLAKLMGGRVAASRKIVDGGLATRAIQVGQSGKTVSPKLYMALGIFGAIQHVEGLKNVTYMIAVNNNEHAPICSLSDIVVVGDAGIFMDMLIKRIEKYNNERPL